jgi:hypothetical protein
VLSGTGISPQSFVRSEQLRTATKNQQAAQFRSWQAYSEKLRRDPALVAYYDFQRRDDSPTTLHAATKPGANTADGTIKGAKWTTGRMSGKQALSFGNEHAYVAVNLPQRMTEMTLAAWLTVELISDGDENAAAGLLMSDGYSLNEHQSPDEWTITVVCERGTARFENHRYRWRWMIEPDSTWHDESHEPFARDFLYIRQANRFLDVLERHASPACSLAEGVQTLRVNLAALASIDHGGWREI